MAGKLTEKEIENFNIKDADHYPVMPLRNTVLFPQQVIPIYIGRERSLKLINDLDPNKRYIVVVAQEDGSIEDPKPEDLYAFGTLAQVLKVFDMPDNSKSAIVQGISRVKILDFTGNDPYFTAAVDSLEDDPIEDKLEVDALATNLRQAFDDLMKVAPNLTEEHSGMLRNIQKPNRLADRAISIMTISNQEKQEVLEELNIMKRIEKSLTLISREIQRIKLGEEIQTEVHDEISKTQREYYLREQMKAIKKELGEDEGSVELKELENKLKDAKMPEEADKVAEDYSKIMTADFVMSMSRKVEDKIANTGRFHIIKNRFGIDGITYPATINTNIGQVLIHEGSSKFGKEVQGRMDNSQEFLRKELANKYKDMEKKVEGFE